MAKIKKTYSLDEKVAERLEALAAAQGLSNSAYLTILINTAKENPQSLAVKGAQ